jgi:hypothetical protein
MNDAVQQLVDRAQIVEVLNRYCRGVDRCDEAELAAAYHTDGTDDHGTFSGSGADFAAWACKGGKRFWSASHHTVHNVIVDWLGGDVAHVESYVLAFNQRADDVERPDGGSGRVEVFAGRYLDRFERRDGAWLISHRQALRDVVTVLDAESWAELIPVGGRMPEDALYHV